MSTLGVSGTWHRFITVGNPDSRFAYPNLVRNFVHYGGHEAPLPDPRMYVVVDVETSGLYPDRGDRVIEIAAHRTSGDGKIVESWSSLVNPMNGEVGLTELHGISPEMVGSAPTFAQVLPEFISFLGDAVFVAHHAVFDASFIDAEARRAGVQIPLLPGLCTYWLSRTVMHDMAKHKLGMLAEKFGVTNSLEHSASADASVVVEILPHLLERTDPIRHYVAPMPRQEPLVRIATVTR
mgnify:CR=1 FL=1